ncbi:MAG: ROK family protein [Clostridia bacterium]|nr:ROK family protein [Clostridia bacterium]
MKFVPNLDKNFLPIELAIRNYEKRVQESAQKNEVVLCVEREDGYNYIYTCPVFSDNTGHDEENYGIVERIAKAILWVVGGYKIYISGSPYIYERLKADYSVNGAREFDKTLMSRVYEKDFEVVFVDKKDIPQPKSCSVSVGGHLDGCRIGFDAGGSDRKVSAVVDGKVVYSEEVVWHPKQNSDPKYHYDGILTAMKTAASKMERVDAIGVSSAGIYVNNRIMIASLFVRVPDDVFEKEVKNMYIDVAKNFGDVPLTVANDGDVTALAGAIDLEDNCVLGIAMGTSEAVGYINSSGGINGWLSELAFVPVDFNKSAMVDEWSGDYGCGVKYFSQDGVIKLAELGGHVFKEGATPAEKLKEIQSLMQNESPLAYKIYEDIGIYLGYTLPFYARFYDIKHVLLLGRVTSGLGGDIIIKKAKEVLQSEFPEYKDFDLGMPDEKSRRVGQSIAAASLPKIIKE